MTKILRANQFESFFWRGVRTDIPQTIGRCNLLEQRASVEAGHPLFERIPRSRSCSDQCKYIRSGRHPHRGSLPVRERTRRWQFRKSGFERRKESQSELAVIRSDCPESRDCTERRQTAEGTDSQAIETVHSFQGLILSPARRFILELRGCTNRLQTRALVLGDRNCAPLYVFPIQRPLLSGDGIEMN